MQASSQVTHLWQKRDVVSDYTVGVSLHSHTSLSLETLSFVRAACDGVPLFGRAIAYYAAISKERHGITLDFESANWRPPLQPLMAFELERKQIMAQGLNALVSITDHDSIQAPLLLRTVAVARRIPVSTEWTAPFGKTVFHLGIHNLPSDVGAAWMQRFERFTAAPSDEELHEILVELDAIPQVLIVLNHPMWDLYKIGEAEHLAELERLLLRDNGLFHAFELNGLRHPRENGAVMVLARRWGQVLISGGDRHGLEANANINLTNATSFTEFVYEIREERRSHVLFLDQYAKPWEQRLLDSTLDAICDHPQFSPGWQRWDERAYHQDAYGTMRSLAELWPNGRAPRGLRVLLITVRMFRYRTLARVVSLLFAKGTTIEGSAAVREVA